MCSMFRKFIHNNKVFIFETENKEIPSTIITSIPLLPTHYKNYHALLPIYSVIYQKIFRDITQFDNSSPDSQMPTS